VRAVTALGTVAAAGVVLVASWQAGQRATPGTAPGIRVVAGASGTPAPTGSGTASGTTRAGASRKGRVSKSRTAATAPPTQRSVTGALVQTPYGTVQVRVSLLGKRITDVTAVHLTDSSSTSVEISAGAAPTLRQEALDAQSANIDLVSGATYTSEGYRTSLQAALDAAHA
jgi:uncharacterized protein with FMN-binding domain